MAFASSAVGPLNVNGDHDDDGDGEDVPLLVTSMRPATTDRTRQPSSAPRFGRRTTSDSASDTSARRADVASSTLMDGPLRADSSSSTCDSSHGRRRSSVLFDQENVRLLRFQAGRMVKTFQGESDPWPRRVAMLLLVIYFGVGIMFFSLDVDSIRRDVNHNPVIDAWYFTTVTLTTVGYGDLVHHGNRGTVDYMFMSIFSLVGVGVVGFCFGVIIDHFNEIAPAVSSKENGGNRRSIHSVDLHSPTAENLLQRKQTEAVRQERLQIVRCVVGLIIMLAIGALIIFVDGGIIQGEAQSARVTLAQAVYFACVTVTTIGYGDIVVKTPAGMCVLSIYLIFSTLLFGKMVTTMASIPLNRRQRRREAIILSQFGRSLDEEELFAICEGGVGNTEISKAEFILRMLVWLDRVEVDEIEIIASKFDILDKSGDGILSVDDVRMLSERNRWKGVRNVFLEIGSHIRHSEEDAPPTEQATEHNTDTSSTHIYEVPQQEQPAHI